MVLFQRILDPSVTAASTTPRTCLIASAFVALSWGVACGGPPASDTDSPGTQPSPVVTEEEPDAVPEGCAAPLDKELAPLAEAFADHFRIGAALDAQTVSGENPAAEALVREQYNHISPENLLKWTEVHPSPGTYRFTLPDAFVGFGEANDMQLYGHVLVWHQQTPEWVFQDDAGDPITADALWERLEDHITQVAGRYGGRIKYWDVVNEALRDDGALRDSPWRTILGDDYVAETFALADKLLPDSLLVYNDYSLVVPAKRASAIELILDMRERGIRVDAVGMQGHYNLRYPQPSDVDAALTEFAAAGIDVLFTELDLSVLPSEWEIQGADLDDTEEYAERLDPYRTCLPQEMNDTIAAHWRGLFEVFIKHADNIEAITFWGVSDAQSWLNNWPIEGRTNYPLLFNRDLSAKTALEAVIDTAKP